MDTRPDDVSTVRSTNPERPGCELSKNARALRVGRRSTARQTHKNADLRIQVGQGRAGRYGAIKDGSVCARRIRCLRRSSSRIARQTHQRDRPRNSPQGRPCQRCEEPMGLRPRGPAPGTQSSRVRLCGSGYSNSLDPTACSSRRGSLLVHVTRDRVVIRARGNYLAGLTAIQ